MTAPDTPAAYPADKSISPRSRTKTNPIAITMTAAACVKRLAKFPGVKNTLDMEPKIAHSATRPKIEGSAPISPDLSRAK